MVSDRLGQADLDQIDRGAARLQYCSGDEEAWRVSPPRRTLGLLVLSPATSHISIHTFPETTSAIIDVLSYQEFSIAQIVDIAIRDYDPLRAELKDLSGYILEPTLG